MSSLTSTCEQSVRCRALEVLSLVREKSHSKEKLYISKHGYAFAPVYGLTSVMMLTSDAMEWFAKPLCAFVSHHPELSKLVLPLPPDSYHVTLRGLERCITTIDVDALVNLERNYCARRSEIGFSFGGRVAASARLKWEDPMFETAAVLLVEPDGDLVTDLAEWQRATAECTGLTSNFMQEYHVSVGYFITEDYSKQRLAQQCILEEAHRLVTSRRESTDDSKGDLALEACHICWYDSMTRFMPLFSVSP